MIILTDDHGSPAYFDPTKVSYVSRRVWLSKKLEVLGSWVRCDGDTFPVKETPQEIINLIDLHWRDMLAQEIARKMMVRPL